MIPTKNFNVLLLLGIQQRSGTNYLNRLLCMHPQCRPPLIKVREDWFLDNYPLLEKFSESVAEHWKNPRWSGLGFEEEPILQHLGAGLLDFLTQGMDMQPGEWLVSKTPSVQNLSHAFALFPHAKIVVLVRDARDVAESARRTWNQPIEVSLQGWMRGVAEIYRLERGHSGKYLLIRYEDVLANPRGGCERMLSYLGLDAAAFPFEELEDVPLLGSSSSGEKWETVPRPANFKGRGKWRCWPPQVVDRVNASLAPFLEYFGYERDPGEDLGNSLPSPAQRLARGEQLFGPS